MFDAIKNFFKLLLQAPTIEQETPEPKRYPLGAQPTEPDVRTIDFNEVVGITTLPTEYKTDLSKFAVFDQDLLGTCVAHAFALVKMVLDFLETGKLTVYSRRFLYVLSRRFLGMVNTDDVNNQGLPPVATAKVITSVGVIAETNLDDNKLKHSKYVNDYPVPTDEIRKQANIARAKGFTNLQVTPFNLKQAIFNTKIVPCTIIIDWDKFDTDGTLHAPVYFDGRHEVVFFGWEIKNGRERFIYRNSWGKHWGTNGNGYVYADELSKVVIEGLPITDIPNDLLERAKGYQYIFLTDLKKGSTGDAVIQLQKRLIEYGLLDIKNPTPNFGDMTKAALMQYQTLKGLKVDGIFGKGSRTSMNEDVASGKTISKIDLWIKAITKMEGAKPENHNPGNIRYIGQTTATGKTANGFCIFPDDATGYMELRKLLVRAATGQSSNYKADMTLSEFYAGIKLPNRYNKEIFGYAPESDGNQPNHYASYVAGVVGVSANTLIKDLL